MKPFASTRRASIASVLIALMALSVVALAGGCGTQAALSDPTKKPQTAIASDKMLTPEDLLYGDIPAGPSMSPDGTRAMWFQGGYSPDGEALGWELYVVNLDDLRRTSILTGTGMFSGPPKWSPDGTALAYVIAGPEGTPQVFTISASGGDPVQVTNEDDGVAAASWRDASTLLFTAEVKDEGDVADEGDDTIHVERKSGDKVRLFQVPTLGGEAKPVTSNNDQITAFWVSPDGGKALTTRTTAADGGDLYYMEIPYEFFLVDLSSGAEKRVFKDVRQVLGAAWSRDSSTLFVEEGYTPDKLQIATITRLRKLEVSSGTESEVSLGWSRGIHSSSDGSSALRATDGGFLASLADGTNPKIASYTKSGSSFTRQNLSGEHQGNIFSFDASADGSKICYQYSTPSLPPQMYVAEISSGAITNPRRFSDLNPGLAGKEMVRHEIITWQGARGEPVEGILYYPSGYAPGKRYPLVLMIHGGPFYADVAEWPAALTAMYPYQMFAQKGAFVLAPNYHGSSDYGLEFARSIRDGKFYEYPVEDIENAISRLVDLGMVDAERLGTLGWSNGSILSHALIARDGRFKAASCGAGGNEWLSLWGAGIQGYAVLEYYFGASPVEDPALYKDPDMAPFYNARDVRTPVVMYQGDADVSVPPTMSWNAYRALQKYGKAPVELFIFPGEGHSPGMVAHQKRKLAEDIKWFDKYLFNKK